jgi:hypothetical protein
MGNNPVSLIDPDGEFVVEALLIGAALGAITGAIKGSNDPNMSIGGGIWRGALIGAAAGAAGGGVGSLVGNSLNTGGFLAGTISGAAGGATGGFVGGFGNTALYGGSLGESFRAGALGAGIGGLSGGILGGISAGIASNQAGHRFWDGGVDMSKYLVACNDCVAYYGMPEFTFLGKYNPVIAGMHQAGQSFWGHPVTQATVFAATSVIGGGVASSLFGAASKGVQASHIAARMAGQGVQNAARSSTATARSLGIAGERAVGITGPKTAINVAGRTRIPDAMTRTTLTEVKNVKSLSFTRQLRDFHSFSQQTGRDFILYTRPNTTLSGPLQNAINQGTIIHRYIPF